MKIISFYDSRRREHWLEKIGKCDWSAGKYLFEIINSGTFFEILGEGSKLLLLTEDDELLSFCTFAKRDEIQPTGLCPWIGFAYTFKVYRGRRLLGLLINYAVELAKGQKQYCIYLSTDHIGLYEKYGFEYLTEGMSIYGDISRIYVKHIELR